MSLQRSIASAVRACWGTDWQPEEMEEEESDKAMAWQSLIISIFNEEFYSGNIIYTPFASFVLLTSSSFQFLIRPWRAHAALSTGYCSHLSSAVRGRCWHQSGRHTNIITQCDAQGRHAMNWWGLLLQNLIINYFKQLRKQTGVILKKIFKWFHSKLWLW